jgi:hypothetical protein
MTPIKNRLREYLNAKGIFPDDRGLIRCPWHEDETPSCRVNDDYLYCFTCNESGDIYAAAALLDVPCDKENFPVVARDVEKTLGIISDWKPPKRKPGEPRVNIKLSQSHVYRSELLKEFSAAIDSGDMERAYNRAALLHALFMLPEGEAPRAPEKPKRTLQDKLAAYGVRGTV